MPNVTISIEEKLLKAGKEYARNNKTSLNALIRDLLRKTVESPSVEWMDDWFNLMDKARADSKGRKWQRSDLYDV